MPLAMMKHLEEDVPPVFMILDTYDKDVKVDNISNWNVEPLIFCIHFLNTFILCFLLFRWSTLFFLDSGAFLFISDIFTFSYFCLTFLPVLGWILLASLTHFSPPEPSSWHPSLLCIWRQLVPVCQVFLLNLHPPLLGNVRYTLRCLVAVPQDTDCVTTIKSTEEKLANKKKELETFQVLHLLKVWDQNYFLFCTYFLQFEFCEIKKKYDAARERLENDVKEITELIQVCYLYM